MVIDNKEVIKSLWKLVEENPDYCYEPLVKGENCSYLTSRAFSNKGCGLGQALLDCYPNISSLLVLNPNQAYVALYSNEGNIHVDRYLDFLNYFQLYQDKEISWIDSWNASCDKIGLDRGFVDYL